MHDNHKHAVELMEDDWQADRDNRADALEDLRFLAGDQWDGAERDQREKEGRPCLTVNRLTGFVNQVAGDIRKAQPAIEVFPVDSGGDVELARIYEGLIRQVEYQSGAHGAYAHGAESAVRCGIGHWRLETDTTADSVFEQEIRIKRVLDPLSVIWDAGSVEIDRSDARRCWVTEFIHKHEFERRFGLKRDGVDVPVQQDSRGQDGLYWRRDDFIRIAEYWYLRPEDRMIVFTSGGRSIDVTGWSAAALDELLASGEVIKARKVEGATVRRRLMDGAGWLGDEANWAGRFIPVVPVIGSEIAFDGRILRHGLIRAAKDPQKLYNYWRSSSAEAIGKSPKAPWLLTPKMVEGWEGYWNNANRSNMPYLPFNPDPQAPGGRPERQQPPQVPAAMWQEAAQASDDMKAATGIFDASLGAQGNETSGRAILARQRMGESGSFVFTDNFALSMRRTGQLLVDLIPRIYDTDRQLRILGPGGQESVVPVNRAVLMADGKQVIVNDLSHGRFDVRVKLGAASTTARAEAREHMALAMQANPELWGVIGDLFFKNSDYPGADDIAERLRRTVPASLLGEDAPETPPDPVAEAGLRLELAAKEAGIAETRASAALKQAEAEKISLETARRVSGQSQGEP